VAAGKADAEGKSQIEKVPAGTCQVSVSADKYAGRCMLEPASMVFLQQD